MIEYISRDDAKVAVWQILESLGYSSKHNDGLVEEVEAVLDDVPAVALDVRCETCRFYEMRERYENKMERYCKLNCAWIGNTGKCGEWMVKDGKS